MTGGHGILQKEIAVDRELLPLCGIEGTPFGHMGNVRRIDIRRPVGGTEDQVVKSLRLDCVKLISGKCVRDQQIAAYRIHSRKDRKKKYGYRDPFKSSHR